MKWIYFEKTGITGLNDIFLDNSGSWDVCQGHCIARDWCKSFEYSGSTCIVSSGDQYVRALDYKWTTWTHGEKCDGQLDDRGDGVGWSV